MDKKKQLSNLAHLQKLYGNGENLTDYLKQEFGLETNSDAVIELSYDIMAGTYISAMQQYPPAYELRNQLGKYIATEINKLCDPSNILDAGIGEASTTTMVMNHLNSSPELYGFDLSWSRLGYASKWLKHENHSAHLCRAEMTSLPYPDNSFDIVITSHAIEPNGGLETQILTELLRVTAGWLVMLEPDYERADEDAQSRMVKLGYCKDIPHTIKNIGYELLKHEPSPINLNPLNPTSLYVVAVNQPINKIFEYACPNTLAPLTKHETCYYSEKSMLAYPILGEVPCFHKADAIIASHFLELNKT